MILLFKLEIGLKLYCEEMVLGWKFCKLDNGYKFTDWSNLIFIKRYLCVEIYIKL